MMILGVFLHAAGVYGVGTSFPVRDPSGTRAFDVLVEAASSFRMPAFFLLAGLFWTYALGSRSLRHVLLRRIILVGLPFLTLALTLQPLQHLVLLSHQRAGQGFDAATFWHSFVEPGVVGSNAFTGRGFIGHLWFLISLLLYYLLAAAALPLLRRLDDAAPRDLVGPVLQHKWLCALLAGGAMIVLRAALRHGAGLHPDFANIVVYLPYFAAGAVAFSRPERFAALRRLGPLDLVLWPLAALVVFHPALKTAVHGSAVLLLQTYFALMAAVVLLRAFQAMLDRPWPLLQRLVDASYSIYLFHYLCVVCVALALLPYPGLPAGLKFGLAVAVGVGLPYALHHGVLARWPLLKLLFNGRMEPGKRRQGAASRERIIPPALDGSPSPRP